MLLSTVSRLFYLYDAASLMRSRIKSLLSDYLSGTDISFLCQRRRNDSNTSALCIHFITSD